MHGIHPKLLEWLITNIRWFLDEYGSVSDLDEHRGARDQFIELLKDYGHHEFAAKVESGEID